LGECPGEGGSGVEIQLPDSDEKSIIGIDPASHASKIL